MDTVCEGLAFVGVEGGEGQYMVFRKKKLCTYECRDTLVDFNPFIFGLVFSFSASAI